LRSNVSAKPIHAVLQLVEKGSSTEWRELAPASDFLDCSRASHAPSVACVELADIYAGGLDLHFDVSAGTSRIARVLVRDQAGWTFSALDFPVLRS
jgi:hypothetical protein